ncbi:endolytic transglycosylase MltG [Labedella endophytica]|uniref:Endolytic murein transglycosylase n=1 Tax=Labedella endophytica TaxID=1523160 RepID=A0A3S0X6X1_9MICO|nr:endolytic transglycosylase MltG [Labedella endophytica]RUR00726.1 endolytic transglycosylase MltG [Labedella endophytica]
MSRTPDPDAPSDEPDPFTALLGGADPVRGASSDRPQPAGSERTTGVGESPAQPLSRREARERASGPTGGPENVGSEPGGAETAGSEPDSELDADAPPHVLLGTATSEQPTVAANRAGRRATSRDDGYPPREKRSRRGLVGTIITLLVVAGLVASGVYVWNTFEPQIRSVMGWEEPNDFTGTGSGEVLVTIADGETGTDIARTLASSGVTKTVDAFYDLLLAEGDVVFQPGVYRLAEEMSARSALDALQDPANKIERTAVIREGLTGATIIEELSAATDIPVADFEAAVADPTAYGVPASAVSMEGWLFPATYTFDPGLTAEQVVQTLVDRTVSSLDSAGVPVEDRERVLTIASIIQREARQSDDFYKVSRVIQNRLDVGMRLEMDSTAQYGVDEASGSVWSSAEALDSVNAWNTYQRDGLPVGPIASPGDIAIDAAMNPADGSWIFFVTVNLNTGETVFTNTIAEHEAAVAQLRSWCADNPDSGC